AKGPFPEKITGLKTPESVVQAKDGTIYISEINEFGKDGDGQINKVDKQGYATVFAKGMDDPKGLTIIGDKLYVADKTRVLEINKDGSWQVYAAETAFPNKPQFLNDLEADKLGNLYVSDSGDLKSGGAIYKIAKGGAISTVADSKNPDILAPNGLLFEGRDNLLSVDFESGILYRVNISTGATTKIADGFSGGDGIVKTKSGKTFISDWKNGAIYQLAAGKARAFKSGFQAAAGITLTNDGKYILVPDMKAGELILIEIK
ncbi:MAG: SMP-30/gluconolactonase/LRE family protein, partial [Methylophilaceae bacterium]